MAIPNFLRFEYKIIIDGECPLFEAEPFASELQNVDSLLMSSAPFSSYNDCVNTATQALATLASFMEQVTDRKHVVFNKYNPVHLGEETSEDEKWESGTVLRIYVADNEQVKSKDVQVTISADVYYAEVDLDYLGSLSGQHQH